MASQLAYAVSAVLVALALFALVSGVVLLVRNRGGLQNRRKGLNYLFLCFFLMGALFFLAGFVGGAYGGDGLLIGVAVYAVGLAMCWIAAQLQLLVLSKLFNRRK